MVDQAPTTRFLRRAGGQRLAYTVHGQGAPLVCPAWWVSHLENDWKQPSFRQLFGGLARRREVVRYDRPGAGLSDREREAVDLEGEVRTLSELVDQLELERFDLFAVSCAGPPAVAYAAAHPERVSRLVFFGSFLRGSDVGPESVKQAMQSLVEAHWGIGSRTITNLFAPDLPAPDVDRMSKSQREAASPEMAARLLALSFESNAEDVAARVRAPALVIHREGDRTIRHQAGRELAAALPDARLLTLEGNAHVPWLGEVQPVIDATLRFLDGDDTAQAEPRPPVAPDAAGDQAQAALERAADVWKVTFGGVTAHLKHAVGLGDLALLLTSPGQEVHAAELWSGTPGTPADPAGADPVLDDAAVVAYRQRLRAVEDAIAEAEEERDADRVERLREERDTLLSELRSAVGLGGRRRRLGEPAERARKAVSSRIRASIRKIAEVHPALALHLEASVHTGVFCVYRPRQDVVWRFSESR